jgi:hypothetical protein
MNTPRSAEIGPVAEIAPVAELVTDDQRAPDDAIAPDGGTSDPNAADAESSSAVPPRRARPLSVSAISLILIVVGGAIEGYAVALSLGDSVERQYSIAWALMGATLVVTAWALRGRRWWGAAAAIGVSIVGLFAGMAGVYGALVIASTSSDDRATWLATLGLIAVGAASIAIIGLLSSAWPWLTATTVRTAPTPPTVAA